MEIGIHTLIGALVDTAQTGEYPAPGRHGKDPIRLATGAAPANTETCLHGVTEGLRVLE